MESIDRLLAEVKAEYEKSADKQPKTLPAKIRQVQPQSPSSIDSLLEQVKTDYEQQDKAEKQLQQQQLKAEQLRQQELQMEQREALKNQVIAWLKQLDSLSSEGIWFEKFAESYPSKLDAAFDYLQDIKDNQH